MSAGAGDRRRPTQAGTAPALMPGDDPFSLSAVPMFCFINASFCRVPWTCGAALVYFSTSLRAQDETPRALPQGMLYSLFPGLVVSRRETPETSSPRPPTLCGTRQAHFCNQPGVFLNFIFFTKNKTLSTRCLGTQVSTAWFMKQEDWSTHRLRVPCLPLGTRYRRMLKAAPAEWAPFSAVQKAPSYVVIGEKSCSINSHTTL